MGCLMGKKSYSLSKKQEVQWGILSLCLKATLVPI